MKNFYLITLAAFFFHTTSATIIKSTGNGIWNMTSTWDLNRIPQIGDTIILISNKTVFLTDDQNLDGFVLLKVFGNLSILNNNSTLNLGSTSSVYVYPFGTISGGGSNSQKIKIGNQQVFKGNDAPITGPQMANSTTSDFDPFVYTPLPVKFVGFSLTKMENKILVQWSTAEELNSYRYELERCYDGNNWITIAYIAAAGISQNLTHYTYNDKNIDAKVIYYRIKQVDVDGTFYYTSIKSIKNEISPALSVSIATMQNQVVLQFSKEVKGVVLVRLVSLNGQVSEAHVINNPNEQIVLETKVKGNYFVSVSNGQGLNMVKQILL